MGGLAGWAGATAGADGAGPATGTGVGDAPATGFGSGVATVTGLVLGVTAVTGVPPVGADTAGATGGFFLGLGGKGSLVGLGSELGAACVTVVGVVSGLLATGGGAGAVDLSP